MTRNSWFIDEEHLAKMSKQLFKVTASQKKQNKPGKASQLRLVRQSVKIYTNSWQGNT
jgi:hypothetical protein